jgi:hypothetical protein
VAHEEDLPVVLVQRLYHHMMERMDNKERATGWLGAYWSDTDKYIVLFDTRRDMTGVWREKARCEVIQMIEDAINVAKGNPATYSYKHPRSIPEVTFIFL